jgi:hypothetical protein
MSAAFAARIEGREADWTRFLAKRAKLTLTAPRHELYRWRAPSTVSKSLPDGGGALLMYDAQLSEGRRGLEQVALVAESGTWRVFGYSMQAVAGP